MKIRPSIVIVALLASITGLTFGARKAFGANTLPLSSAWTIAPSGKAASSGELLFRVTPGDGSDPIELTVSVASGTNDVAVARNIRRVLSSQLRADRFNVTLGEGANVLVTDQRGQPNFSIELLDSDVEAMRVTVQSAAPVAPPTVPEQSTPSNPPLQAPVTPPAPGDVVPPSPPAPENQPGTQTPATPPPTQPPGTSSPVSQPPTSPSPAAPPPNATGGAGAPASAPPPGSTPPPGATPPPR